MTYQDIAQVFTQKVHPEFCEIYIKVLLGNIKISEISAQNCMSQPIKIFKEFCSEFYQLSEDLIRK